MHNFASSSENLIQFRKKIEDFLICCVKWTSHQLNHLNRQEDYQRSQNSHVMTYFRSSAQFSHNDPNEPISALTCDEVCEKLCWQGPNVFVCLDPGKTKFKEIYNLLASSSESRKRIEASFAEFFFPKLNKSPAESCKQAGKRVPMISEFTCEDIIQKLCATLQPNVLKDEVGTEAVFLIRRLTQEHIPERDFEARPEHVWVVLVEAQKTFEIFPQCSRARAAAYHLCVVDVPNSKLHEKLAVLEVGRDVSRDIVVLDVPNVALGHHLLLRVLDVLLKQIGQDRVCSELRVAGCRCLPTCAIGDGEILHCCCK